MNFQIKSIIAFLIGLLLLSIGLNISNVLKLNSKKAELSSVTEEVERLKSYQSLYAESDKDKKAANQIVYDVIQENDSLKVQIQQANDKISYLEGKIKELENTNRVHEMARVKGTKQTNDNSGKSVKEVSLQDILKNINSQLLAMRDAKDKDKAKVIKIKMSHRDRVLQLLDQLDSKTNKSLVKKTSEIRNELKDNSLALKIDTPDKNNIYQSTRIAKKKIDELIKQIESIRKKLKIKN